MITHSSFLSVLFEHAEKISTKPALIVNDTAITFFKLKTKILQAISVLRTLPLRKGDYIMLSAQKDVEFIYIYLAAHYLGVINIVVDAESNKKRIDYIVGLLSPKYAFGFQLDNTRCIQYADIDWNIEPADEYSQDTGMTDADVADVLFTTGTTGLPKGVLLTHDNIISAAHNINGFIGNTQEDREVIALPICHSFGLGRLRCNLVLGSTVVLLGSFADMKQFFKTIEDYQISGFGMVPSSWAYIRKFSGTRIAKYAGQIKYIEIGSASMPITSKQELCELFPSTRICMHYGLTEASRSAFMEFHTDYARLNTIGRPVSQYVDIKIYDESGQEVPVGIPGEICVKGNMVMKSYYLEKDNENSFFNGYFRTGDWGYGDSEGYFYLESRKKELINAGGKKVSPIEVEEAICSLGIRDCVCIGVEDPKKIMGEIVKAYILKEGCTLSFSEISSGLRPLLETYKIPLLYEWIDVIPATASGKKQRLSLK
ncbi:MAG: acyl--CoA ligase [Prevotella sp.]|jgi:long-chain acyl-CoA synthetase|nr:acyl--CoA ligase [Prevotella sp.]